MVGSAQYRDEEIGWILSAVVAKKTQQHIQENFENKFGRSLNHNQIRYIKNKYGKDPKFNSPLVNIRTSRTAVSPSSSLLDSNDRDDTTSIATTTASERQRPQVRRRITPADGGNRTKRKRSLEDDGRESSVQRMAKTQHSRPQSYSNSNPVRASTTGSGMPLWNTLGLGRQLTASLHSLSPPPPTPESIYGNSSMYDAGQQLMQGTGSFNWTPSVNNVWNLGESPGLINASRHPPSTFFQNAAPSPVDLNYYIEQTPVSSHFQTPVRTHHSHSQFSLPYSSNIAPIQFSPSMHHLIISPNLSTELRYGPGPHLQPPAETQQSPRSFHEKLSNTKPLSGLMIEPFVGPPIPSFEQLPILPSDYTHSPGGTANPWMITYPPYEPLPFDPAPSYMPWPFEHVKDVGLTAISSIDIRKDVQERESRYREEIASLATMRDSNPLSPKHVSRDLGPNVLSGLQTLNMAKHYIPRETPDDAAQYAASVYAKAITSSLALESASQSQKSPATDCAATIDPKLLSDRHLSASLALTSQSPSGIPPLTELSQTD